MTACNKLNKFIPNDVLSMVHNMARFEKKLRDKGINDLKAYFERKGPISQSVMCAPSLLVIWRGLHVAVVQQEDPLLQEELCDRIGGLVYCFKKEKSANAFLKAGFETFGREWDKFNIFLVNKLMMFFRRVVRHALFRLADQRWEHTSQFVDLLESNVILPQDDKNKFPLSPKLHLATIIFEELAKASNEYLTEEVVYSFMLPYLKVLTVSRIGLYLDTVKVEVFHHLLRQSDAGIDGNAYLPEDEYPILEAEKLREQRKDFIKQLRMHRRQQKSRKGGIDELSDAKMGSEDEEQNVDEEEEAEEEEEEEEEEESMDDEDASSEEQDEFPLDPRAGNVDVLLPQLPIDYEKLGRYICELSLKPQVRFGGRQRLLSLLKKINDVSDGVFTAHRHPSRAPLVIDTESEILDALETRAMEDRTELQKELKSYNPGGKNKKERNYKILRHNNIMEHRVRNILIEQSKARYRTHIANKSKNEAKYSRRRMRLHSRRNLRLRTKLHINRLKSTGEYLNKKQFMQKKLKISQARDKIVVEKIDKFSTKLHKN